MASKSAAPKAVGEPFDSESRSIVRTTERPIGTSISVVAVFEIHIERKADARRKPKTSARRLSPTRARIPSAILRWSPLASMPRAMMKPPSNKKRIQWA